MKNNKENGAAVTTAKAETSTNGAAKTDTAKGATAMAAAKVEPEKVEPPKVVPQPESLLQQRLKKIVEMQKLSTKRKNLIDVQDKVNFFEEGLDGEDDVITLGFGKNALEIVKPDAVKQVVELLKNNVQQAITQVDNDLLAATI